MFQFREGGNYYTRVGGTDICLESSDFTVAESNLNYQESLTTRFGVNAFKFSVNDLFPQFLKDKAREVKKGDLRESTYHLYENIWTKYLKPGIGQALLADVDQRVWDKFCRKNDSVSDFQNYRNLTHGFMVWCAGKGHIKAIPILKNPKHRRRKRKVIPPQHLQMILQHARGSLLLFLSMALFQGMRRKEIMTLEWSRVDFDRLAILLRDLDVKTAEGREIPMNATVHKLLVQRLSEQQSARVRTPWVFPHADASRDHATLGGLMSAWRTCLLHSGLAARVKSENARLGFKVVVEYTWHDMRATYEKYSNLALEFTDTQKEKMVGADIDVQKRIYVSMTADDLRGLERVVSNQVPELAQIVDRKTVVQKVGVVRRRGNLVTKQNKDCDNG